MSRRLFTAGDARTVAAARLGGLVRSLQPPNEAERREIGERSRAWWSQFTADERRAMMAARLKGRRPGRPRGWTLDVTADHAGVLAMRANGLKFAETLCAQQRVGRILRKHQAQDLSAQGFSHRDIAAAMSLRLDTVRSYFRD